MRTIYQADEPWSKVHCMRHSRVGFCEWPFIRSLGGATVSSSRDVPVTITSLDPASMIHVRQYSRNWNYCPSVAVAVSLAGWLFIRLKNAARTAVWHSENKGFLNWHRSQYSDDAKRPIYCFSYVPNCHWATASAS